MWGRGNAEFQVSQGCMGEFQDSLIYMGEFQASHKKPNTNSSYVKFSSTEGQEQFLEGGGKVLVL